MRTTTHRSCALGQRVWIFAAATTPRVVMRLVKRTIFTVFITAICLALIAPRDARAQCDDLNPTACGSVSGEAVSCDSECFEALGGLFEDIGEAFVDFWEWVFSTEPEPTPEEVEAENAAKSVKAKIDNFHESAMEQAPVDGAEFGSQWLDEAAVEPEIAPNVGAASRSGNVKAPTIQGEVAPPVDGSVERTPADDFGSIEADTDPVALRKGEFVLHETDQEFTGAEPQLRLIRSYRSRVNFQGSLGPGWDHNLNARIFTNSSGSGCEKEVVVSVGDLNPIPMRPSAPDSNTYEGELGASSVRLKLQTDPSDKCNWQLTMPNFYQYCFTSGGFVTKITAPNGGWLDFSWSDLTKEDEARVLKTKRYLKGQQAPTHTLVFTYTGMRLDAVELEGAGTATRVSYKYNGLGQLERVEDAAGVRARYEYDPDLRVDDNAVQFDGLQEYCERYCSMGSECGVESYCAQRANTRTQGCRNPKHCSESCDDAFDELIDSDVQKCKDEGHDSQNCRNAAKEVLGAFREEFTTSCEAACHEEYDPCDAAEMVAECEDSNECETACTALATNPEVYVYGVPSDLNHNLTSVRDGEGNVLVENVYGDDPRNADFDAVTEQTIGERSDEPMTFKYYDLERDEMVGVVTEHQPDAAPSCVSYLESVLEESQDVLMIPWENDVLTGEIIPGPFPFPSPSPEPPPEWDFDDLTPYRELMDVWEVGSESLFPRTFGIDEGVQDRTLVTTTAAFGLTPVFPTAAETPGLYPSGAQLLEERLVLPFGYGERDIGLFATDGLKLGDRSVVDAVVFASGGQLAQLGFRSSVATLLSRAGSTQIGNEAAFGQALVQGSFTVGSGVVNPVQSRTIGTGSGTWRFGLASQLTGGRVELGSGTTSTLAPGTYDEVVVRQGATLMLARGAYTVRSVIFELGSKVQGPAVGLASFGVKQTFQWRGAATLPAEATASHVLWVYAGTDELHFDGALAGTVVAPKVKVNLKPGQHWGSVFAKVIDVHADAILHHVAIAWNGLSAQRATPKAFQLPNAAAIAQSTGISRSNLLPTLLGVPQGALVATVRTADGMVPYARVTGVGALSLGSCSRGFGLDTKANGDVTISPANACNGQPFEVTALAKFVDSSVPAWERLLPSARVSFEPAAPSGGEYRRVALDRPADWAEAWRKNVDRVLGTGILLRPRSGKTVWYRPAGLTGQGQTWVNDGRSASELFAALGRTSGLTTDSTTWASATTLRNRESLGAVSFADVFGALDDSPGVTWLDWSGQSGERPEWSSPSKPGTPLNARCGKLAPTLDWNEIDVRWATTVSRPNGTTLVSYYDSRGDNVRTVDVETDHVVSMGYDGRHNLVARFETAAEESVAPVMCLRHDQRGLVVEQTQFASEFDYVSQCASYASSRPYLTALTVPNDGSVFDNRPILAFSMEYDANGNPRRQTDGRGDVTTFNYDLATNRLSSVDLPNGAKTSFEDYSPTTGLPRRVIEDSTDKARKTEYAFDVYGHVKGVSRFAWGPDEAWDWTDRVRAKSHTVSHDFGAWTETFGYYGNGRLKSRETQLSKTGWTYSPEGLLESATVKSLLGDAATTQQCAFHDVQGNLTQYVSELGLRTRVERDYAPGVITERTGLSHFDEDSEVCPRPDPEAERVQDGLHGEVQRDALGRVTRQTSSDGVVHRFEYDGFGRLAEQIDGSGERVLLRYDGRSRLSARVYATKAVAVPRRVSSVALSSLADPAIVAVAFYDYDGANELRLVSQYARRAAGEPLTLTDKTAWARDAESRQLVETREVDEEQLVSVTTFDGLGRPVLREDNANNKTSIVYPSHLESTVSVRGPDGSMVTTKFLRNQLGAPVAIKDSVDKLVASWDYDEYGRQVWQQTEAGAGRLTEYNGLSQPMQHIEQALPDALDNTETAEVTTLEYNSRNQLSGVRFPDTVTTEYSYDTLGRVVHEDQFSLLGTIDFEYVAATTKPATVEFPSGRRWEYTYNDPRGLLTSITARHSGGSGTAGPSQLVREFVRGSRGLVTRAGQGAVVATRTYDGHGRQTGDTGMFASVVKYGLGGVPKVVSHGSRAATFDYTADGRAQALTLDGQEVFSAEFSGAGPAQFMNYGNGAAWQRVFDARGRITDEGDANLQLAYRYGQDGRTRLIQTEPQVPFGTSSTVLPPRTQMFGMDAIGRLGEELTLDAAVAFPPTARLDNNSLDEYRSAALQDVKTKYDRAGNISIQTGAGADWIPDAKYANAYARDRDGTWMDYDEDGRLLGDGEREYFYDAFGDLVQTSGLADTCDYKYDAFGRRVSIQCDYDSTEFAHFGRTVTSTRINGTERHYFRGDGSPGPTVSVSETGSDTVEYYSKSKDGSVQTVSNQAGHVRAHYRYGVYGETELIGGGTTNRFGFQGQIHDTATGMYHMGARYYSPSQGRFITRDPIGALGGANLYMFALNRPNDFRDPWGLTPYANPYTAGEMCSAYPCGEAEAQAGPDDFVNPYTTEMTREAVSGLSSGVVTSLWPGGALAEGITGMDTAEFLSGGESYHDSTYYFTKGGTEVALGGAEIFGGGTMFFSGGALLVTTDGLAVAASVPLMAGGMAVAGQGVTTVQGGWSKVGQGFDMVFNQGSESGNAQQAVGAVRENRVADVTGGRVSGERISAPSLGSTDIDVVAGNGDLVMVGGPKKAADFGNLGRVIKLYLAEASSRGVGVQAHLAGNTPQSVFDFIAKRIGAENVFRIPE